MTDKKTHSASEICLPGYYHATESGYLFSLYFQLIFDWSSFYLNIVPIMHVMINSSFMCSLDANVHFDNYGKNTNLKIKERYSNTTNHRHDTIPTFTQGSPTQFYIKFFLR